MVEARGADLPLVVCGNKTDCDQRQVDRVETEALVQLDWEVLILILNTTKKLFHCRMHTFLLLQAGYRECSAKTNNGVDNVFR